MWTVGELADATGITVRTLHHYDQIGLLVPTRRDPNGYRRYDTDDLRRLRRILFYRELDLPLDDIATLLDDETADERAHLERQAAELDARIGRLTHIRKAVTQALETIDMDSPHNLSTDEIREVFGDEYADKAAEYSTEARERWGDTDAWQQSARRTRQYTKADWEEIKAEGDAITAAFADLLRAGADPASEEAMEVAERHRRSIHDRFYDCDHEFHANLADMYVSDPRFTATYEAVEAGLAEFIHDAVIANGVRHG